ncbi:unnamed protein product [[Candida] boidinii]|nr:unnamed protein product [[Candida] boidinii]
MDREVFSFEELKPKLLANNDPQSADGVQLALSTYLTNIYLNFENESNKKIDTNNDNTPPPSDDLIFILDQLDLIINHYIEFFGKNKSNDSTSSEIYHLSHNVITLLGKVYSHILSIMLKQAHEKFNIRLIDITNKMSDIFMNDIKKLSMSKNWYSTLKHLSIIILQFIFTKLNGFLNTYKNPLLTVSYKHLKKCYDNYNSAIDNSTFKSNYFTDILKLIDIILANDTSNKALDDKLFKRLIKLTKQINSKNSNGLYTYSLLSVVHTNNFLISLLKSDKFISSITTKKSSLNPYHYLNQTNSYTQILISSMDTNNKKFRLSVSKNLADLLVFNYIVYGINLNQSDNCFDYILDFLLNEYLKKSNNYKIKTGIIEVIIQFFSKTNLYYQTNTIQNNGNNDGSNSNNNNNSSFSNTGDVLHGSNFMSLKFFATLNKIYFKIFNVGNLKNSTTSKKTSSLKKLKEPHDLLTINDSTTFNEAITTLNQLEQLYKFLINEVGSDINKLIILDCYH